ncbi:hypothetical protein [Chitinimonas lacunae]|uniref:Lipoprotein n=1 Tax=Chitinimonas lacunae TaxID=1963018 RepID=A0ABV8MSH3_9NEIS
MSRASTPLSHRLLALAAAVVVSSPVLALNCPVPTLEQDGVLCIGSLDASLGGQYPQFEVQLRRVPDSNPARFRLETLNPLASLQSGEGLFTSTDGQLRLPRVLTYDKSGQQILTGLVLALDPSKNPLEFEQIEANPGPLDQTPKLADNVLTLPNVSLQMPGSEGTQHFRVEFDYTPNRLQMRNLEAGIVTTWPSYFSLGTGELLIPSVKIGDQQVRLRYRMAADGRSFDLLSKETVTSPAPTPSLITTPRR